MGLWVQTPLDEVEMSFQRHQHSGKRNAFKTLGTLCAFSISILLLEICGVFASLDIWAFDKFSALQSRFGIVSSHTLVIKTERQLSPLEVRILAEQSAKQGAELTVFFDDRVSLLSSVGHLKNTFVISLANLTVPTTGGICRGPGTENVVAKLLKEQSGVELSADLNKFDGKVLREGLPALDFERVLSEDIPASFFSGKVVLIGRDLPGDRSIVTPIHRGDNALSPVFYYALVADSILRQGMIRDVPPRFAWGLGAVGATGLLLWLRFRNYRGSPCVYVSIILVILLISGVTLVLSNQWISPVGLSVLPVSVIFAATCFREIAERDSLQETLRSLAVETRGMTRKTKFSREYSPWMMVEKTFCDAFSDSEGFALAHTGEGTLIPVSESGVEQSGKWFAESEMRPQAEPFATALRDGSILMGGQLAIVPIRTPARLVGFWVFDTSNQRTIAEAGKYAERMAHYLERRKKKNHHEVPSGSERPLHDQLALAINSLEHGRRVIAGALDCSREAVLVFDSLGVSEHVSQPSLELFASAGIEFEDMSPLNLLGHLTNISEAEIRWSLRFVALHRKEASLLTRPDLIPGRTFFIHLRPLETHDPSVNETGLPGLVILIEDATDIANNAMVKDEFMERFHFQCNNDFEAILSAAGLIIDPRISRSEQKELLEVITEKVHEATGLFKETRFHLQKKFGPEIVERFPIRFERIFEAARASIEPRAHKNSVTLNFSKSEYLPLVLASPKALEDLIHSILLSLIQNAAENSEISIDASQVEGAICVTMKNRGFGMPEEQLRNLLDTGAGGWDTLDRIGSARQTVAAWGGALSVKSQVGQGIEFQLNLATVL